MNSQDPLVQARRQTALAWHEGGLTEIALGLFFLLLSLLFYLEQVLERGTPLHRAIFIGQMLFMIGGIGLISRGLPWLRNKLFANRAGYFRPTTRLSPERRKIAIIAGIVSALTAAAVAGLAVRNHSLAQPWLMVLLGILGGFMLLRVGLAINLKRFLFLSPLILLAGLLAAFMGQDFERSIILAFALWGVVLLSSGLFALRHFLHTTPPSETPYEQAAS